MYFSIIDFCCRLKTLCDEANKAVMTTVLSIHNIWLEVYGTEDSLDSTRVNELKAKLLVICIKCVFFTYDDS